MCYFVVGIQSLPYSSCRELPPFLQIGISLQMKPAISTKQILEARYQRSINRKHMQVTGYIQETSVNGYTLKLN